MRQPEKAMIKLDKSVHHLKAFDVHKFIPSSHNGLHTIPYHTIPYCCRKFSPQYFVSSLYRNFLGLKVLNNFSGWYFWDLEQRLSTFIVKTLMLQLHVAIYRPDSFILMVRYCPNLKAIRYESTNLNRIVADKSHCVIVA